MKRITIDISDDKADFFEELIKNLEFIKVKDNGFNISEAHKNLVLKRVKKSDPSKLLSWDKALKNLRTR